MEEGPGVRGITLERISQNVRLMGRDEKDLTTPEALVMMGSVDDPTHLVVLILDLSMPVTPYSDHMFSIYPSIRPD